MINWSLLHFIGFLLPWIFMKLSHGLGTRHGAGCWWDSAPCRHWWSVLSLVSKPPRSAALEFCVQTSERAPVVLTFKVDQSMSDCWSFFLLSFHWIQFYFFHMQVTQHLHMHIFFCSIHKSLTPILSPSLDVPGCCSENVLNTINHNTALNSMEEVGKL